MRISTSSLSILTLSAVASTASAGSLKSSGVIQMDAKGLETMKDAVRKLNRASDSVVSKYQSSSSGMKHRFLDTEDDAALSCLISTMALGAPESDDTTEGDDDLDLSNNPFGDIMGDSMMGMDEESCNQDTMTCDFSSTYADAKADCDELGGKIINNDIRFCEEDFLVGPDAPADAGPGGDLLFKNIPMCVADSCDDDVSFADMVGSLMELMESLAPADDQLQTDDAMGMGSMPKFMTGESCDSGLSTTSGAVSAKTFGSLMLASAAGALALFTL